MEQLRITAVSYYNTLPFIYGINRSGLLTGYKLSLNVPSECARKLISHEADLGLIPVGALPFIPDYKIISKYCIGAAGDVQSVILLTDTELHSLKRIYLDTDSRTSVTLVKVLAKEHWNIDAEWVPSKNLNNKLSHGEGMVAIGDKTFWLRNQYKYCYDLAGEWIKLTGLPFVFAVWISVKEIPEHFLNAFESALKWGVEHKQESISLANNLIISEQELHNYLENAIDYPLDEAKLKGMNLFLSKLKGISA
ncbi:MAG TPA: menaquinone biosynthesis protein [Bacteroidales bacterium]|nr:menaquinone biosynthesis protein [Bacteroidales bacterium]